MPPTPAMYIPGSIVTTMPGRMAWSALWPAGVPRESPSPGRAQCCAQSTCPACEIRARCLAAASGTPAWTPSATASHAADWASQHRPVPPFLRVRRPPDEHRAGHIGTIAAEYSTGIKHDQFISAQPLGGGPGMGKGRAGTGGYDGFEGGPLGTQFPHTGIRLPRRVPAQ